MLTLYAEIKGIHGQDRYREAYRRIGEDLSNHSRYHGINPGQKSQNHELKREVEKAAKTEIDRTYRSLLALLSLSKEHEEKLKLRGLLVSQIERLGARSVPFDDRGRYARMLIKQGCTVRGVPGFYKNHQKNWDIAFPKKGGILFPIPDKDGVYAGIQIRMDQVENGRKYLWFSSSRYPEGVSCGSPVAFFGDTACPEINVTEGGLKAYCTYCLSGKSFIGIPGVGQTRSLEEFLNAKSRSQKAYVRECMDMDKFMEIRCDRNVKCCDGCKVIEAEGEGCICPEKLTKRTNIREGCNRLYRMCDRYGSPCKRIKWNVDKEGIWNGEDKGIDDYYYARILQDRREGAA